ncbi:apolipoprotein D and lipocalin family protein [Stenotrophomonas rhizophila]|uniref:Apolipoprotein D and lipocalin family protein n=1 Tax=Stenotrophomonas rhizophila TaxID=216778 RepID=A0AAP5EDR2_9GAMM|nr:apolipoprotein D and lipocalin family protein [Stenotrophomonas rhizophila]
MRLRPALFAAALLLTSVTTHAVEPVRSVPALDMGRYAGQWHEIAHLPVSFQKKCVGDITATYALRADGRISVHNACRTGDGERIAAEGVARPVEGEPGQLQVRFVPDWLAWVPLVWADYWVIALDPDYQWAVVGGGGRPGPQVPVDPVALAYDGQGTVRQPQGPGRGDGL